MRYIIIEDYDTEYPEIVTFEGKPRIFADDEAAYQASHNYRNAIVVPLSKELMCWEEDKKWPESDTTVYL